MVIVIERCFFYIHTTPTRAQETRKQTWGTATYSWAHGNETNLLPYCCRIWNLYLFCCKGSGPRKPQQTLLTHYVYLYNLYICRATMFHLQSQSSKNQQLVPPQRHHHPPSLGALPGLHALLHGIETSETTCARHLKVHLPLPELPGTHEAHLGGSERGHTEILEILEMGPLDMLQQLRFHLRIGLYWFVTVDLFLKVD